MTTQIKFRFVGLLAFLFTVSNSFSQSSNVENLQFSLRNISYDKTYSSVLTNFHKHFSDAANVSWYHVKKDFGAKFTINDLRYRVLFNKKGKLVYKITYGKEKHLPVEIRKAVKREYVEFRITAASLVEEANRSVWVIHLEDDWEYVIVRVENNEIDENMKYKKQQ
jgi:hypothetical protein